MYYYLFEAQHGPKEYERVAQIKELLSSLGIAGEMATPAPGHGVEDLVASAIAKRYSTVIAVGGIELVNRVAHALEPYDAVFGIIPIFDHPDIARLIGTSDWKTAAEQLKRRRWRPIRLGSMNGSAFFVMPAHVEVPTDVSYEITGPDFVVTGLGQPITVVAAEQLEVQIGESGIVKRGFLKSLFTDATVSTSVSEFRFDKFDLTCSREVTVKVAGVPMVVTPVQFRLQDKELKLIVGKGLSE